MDQRDIALEYLHNLNFDGIKNLCQSNAFYRQFCKNPQAQQIIRNRYIEDKELPSLINNNNLKNATYTISDTHNINIQRYSKDKFQLSEFIGESDYFDLTRYQENQPISKLTPAQLNESILPKLFPTDVISNPGLNSINIIYEKTITQDPYQSLNNVLKEIFKTGVPIIEKEIIRIPTFQHRLFRITPTVPSVPRL